MHMKAIPVAVRERIIHLYDKGKSTKEIASVLDYCVAAVRRVRQQFRERGTLEPQTHLCGRKTLLTPGAKPGCKPDRPQPDTTLAELGTRMDRRFDFDLDLWLRRLGLTYKKNAARRRTEPPRRGRTDGRAGMSNWRLSPPPGWFLWMKAGPTPA